MRVWIMLGVGALMLASAVLPSGALGATIEDVRKEMAQTPSPFWGTRLSMRVPMDPIGVAGNVNMPMTELCASGGRLRPMSEGAAGTDWGPVPEGKEYTVQVYLRNAIGDELFLYERKVTLPDCK
jgi:hypothetical protein